MITLTIGNSLCRIEGLTDTQFKQLRDILSYSSGNYFSGHRGPQKRYLLDRKGNFPSGLMYLVEKYLESCPHERVDLRKRPEPLADYFFKLSMAHTPYSEQNAAVEAAIAANRGIISAPTGSGKSVMIALLIARLKVPTLVVVPSLELKRQLSASLKACFGETNYIRVENVDALDPKVILKGFHAVIIDEFHHSGAATYRKLNMKSWSEVYYKFGFTATPFRSRDEERLLLESVLSEVIYEIPYQYCVDNKRIVPVEAYYVDLPHTIMKGNPNSWPAVYSELVVNNVKRNEIITSLMQSLAGTPTLCLIKEIRHGEILSDLTGVKFANGQADNTRELILEFCLGETRSLIGTVGVLGEGVDSKPAEIIILAGGGKAKTQFMQAIGRGVRTYPGKESCKVILFRDSSNKFLLKHYRECVKILREEYGIEPVKLEI